MKLPHLTRTELSVMDLLWQQKELTARQIKERLYPDATKSQHGTVQKLLQSLEEKGLVKRDRSLGIHLFSPVLERQVYASRELESLTERLTGGSLVPLVTQLIQEDKISRDEIASLRRLLDQKDDEESDT